MENNFLGGNGLMYQLLIDTGAANIVRHMCMIDPKYIPFRKIVEAETEYEFEKLFAHMDEAELRSFKKDFSIAMCEIVGHAENLVNLTASVISRFDRVHSLNFDPLMIGVFNRLVHNAKLVIDVHNDERLSHVQKELQLQKINLRMNFCTLPAARNHGPLILHNLSLVHALDHIEDASWHGDGRAPDKPNLRLWYNDGYNKDGKGNDYKYTEAQNFSFPHGSFWYYILYEKFKSFKIPGFKHSGIRDYLEQLDFLDGDLLFVLRATPAEKMREINANDCLSGSMKTLREAKGTMVVYGLNIYKQTDRHIWEAIGDNKEIRKVYISTGDADPILPDWLGKVLKEKEVEFYSWDLFADPDDQNKNALVHAKGKSI